MKILQTFLACLVFLIGQVTLSYAVDIKEEIIPVPVDQGIHWGRSVDISGTTLIAGYGSKFGNFGNDDGVYIMEQKGNQWEVLNHFPSPNPGRINHFGLAVALEENLAVIGAPEQGGMLNGGLGLLGAGPGKIYVYRRGGGGNFALMEAFRANDVQNLDRFGYSVDISGTTLIVSAPLHDQEKGAVYVYVLEGNKWEQQAKLQADDASRRNRFGWDCAISEKTIVVGAPLAAAPDRNSGAAYIFKRRGDAWAQVAKLAAHDGDGGDGFGVSVDISRSRAIVGANKDENNGNKRGSGSAYIFSEIGDAYRQEAKLTADKLQDGANFGLTVAIDINRALIGAPSADTKVGNDSGAVYAFLKIGPDWELQTTIMSERGPGRENSDLMGYAVALDGKFGRDFNYAAIGAPWDATPEHPDGGSVYLFDTEDAENLNIPLSKDIESFNIPASVDPTDELALIMLGEVKRTALLQNFPNPFNPETWIPYTLADAAAVQVRIYDVQGVLVRRLDIGRQGAGRYFSRQTAAYWDGRDQFGVSVASGVYFYTLEADAFSETRRMVIRK